MSGYLETLEKNVAGGLDYLFRADGMSQDKQEEGLVLGFSPCAVQTDVSSIMSKDPKLYPSLWPSPAASLPPQ